MAYAHPGRLARKGQLGLQGPPKGVESEKYFQNGWIEREYDLTRKIQGFNLLQSCKLEPQDYFK